MNILDNMKTPTILDDKTIPIEERLEYAKALLDVAYSEITRISLEIDKLESEQSWASVQESVADDFGVDYNTVVSVASLLGPSEDFDGLLTTLEDYSEELF